MVGADYCFQNSDGQCTLKRLNAIDDDEYVLAPLNRRYEPLRLPKQLLARVSIVETIVRPPWEAG
jgi:SOS-response transcriptional repressor LexA